MNLFLSHRQFLLFVLYTHSNNLLSLLVTLLSWNKIIINITLLKTTWNCTPIASAVTGNGM